MRFLSLYYILNLCTLLYIYCMIICSLKMFDLSGTDPIDLGFNNVLEDSCTYVDLTELESCPGNPSSLNTMQRNLP